VNQADLRDRLTDLLRAAGVDVDVIVDVRAEVTAHATPDPAAHLQAEAPTVLESGTADDAPTAESTPDGVVSTWVLPAAPQPTPHGPPRETETSGRYQDMELIGLGAMGEVRRVLDSALNRPVAMKILRAEHAGHRVALRRFDQEAQATAQLEHPGIIPVYDVGILEDGRPYFTMKEIRGRTLSDVIGDLHPRRRARQRGDWTLRRVIAAFRQVCEAMAYAHSRAVIHRDLKPANIMVGDFGEVRILDWGLAKVLGRSEGEDDDEPIEEAWKPAPVSLRGEGPVTVRGSVAGTPAYMAPEQARGEPAQIGPAADVYALGAILYEILAGRRPYAGLKGRAVLEAVRRGPPTPPQTSGSVPRALLRTCLQAMAREPDQRFRDAGGMVRQLGAWLDGDARREQARAIVEEATALRPRIVDLRSRAQALSAEAEHLLGPVPASAPITEKRAGWAKEDAAEHTRREAERTELDYLQQLRAALTHDPDLPEAHDALAEQWRSRHADAEERDAEAEAERHEVRLRSHDTGRHSAYLAGQGRLSLESDPPGAQVALYPYESRDRHLVLGEPRDLGPTPLDSIPLSRGRYLLTLSLPGHQTTRYPVRIDREHHWDGSPPGASAADPVRLLPASALDPLDCFVPAGWFRLGGDPQAPTGRPSARRWQDAFVIRRFPVTNRDYIRFLDDLVAQGREAEALAHAPQQQAGAEGGESAQFYGRNEDGSFYLRTDSDGDRWDPDWPVIMVDRAAALAWCRWHSERTGQPWTLPTRDQWEKAARGTDGRPYPWGWTLDPTFCCMRDSHTSRPLPARVDTYPIDESPYGVRGMGGNVLDWCLDLLPTTPGEDAGEVGLLCGGSWYAIPALIRSANALRTAPLHRSQFLGFRPVRPFDQA